MSIDIEFKKLMMSKGIWVFGYLGIIPPKIIVPFSGGKDSQSCLKMAVEKVGSDNVLVLFCDTKFEHSITYNHVNDIVKVYGCNHLILNAGSVESVCIKYKRFPRGGSRHCTSTLKIRPSKFAYRYIAELYNSGFEVWYGMRAAESTQRKKRYDYVIDNELYDPHEVLPSAYPKYLSKKGIKFRLPIIDWSDEEVYKYLNGEHNKLYDEGFDRVGCFPCLAGGEALQLKAFTYDEEGQKHYEIAKRISYASGYPIFRTKKLKIYNDEACMFCKI